MATKKSTNKRAPAGRNVKKSGAASKKRRTAKKKRGLEHDAAMVILFAVAVFMFFVTIIEGDNLWFDIHTLVLGIFGSLAVLWSIFLIYIAVGMAARKDGKSFNNRCFGIGASLLLASCFLYIFFEGEAHHGAEISETYAEILSACYSEAGRGNGIGLSGAITGALIAKAFGLVGAKISIVLIIFVYIMLITRSKIDFVYNLFHKLKVNFIKWVKDIRKALEKSSKARAKRREEERLRSARERRAEAAEAEREALEEEKAAEHSKSKPAPRSKGLFAFGRDDDLDISVDEDEDEPDETDSMRENEKYQRLKEVFGIDDDEEEEKEKPSDRDDDDVKGFKRVADFVRDKDKDKIKEGGISTIEPIDKNEQPPVDALREENVDFYRFPPVSLLTMPEGGSNKGITAEVRANGERLVQTLKSFGVSTKILDISLGPAVTRYELQPSAGVKISKITGLADDIALNLAANGVRIEAPIPGKPAVGIEIPNQKVTTVHMREILDTNEFTVARSKLTVALGRDIGGQAAYADLSKMPHLLIAGATGSGKSVCINSIIVSLLYKASPDEVKMLMVDPKVVELGIYNGIPHLLVPVVTDPKKAAGALAWAVTEMLKRYNTFAENNVRDIFGYNELAAQTEGMTKMPQVVIIIDELADLMMAAPHEVEDSVFRLAQMARAAGMYLIIATQRPSVDVITGVIKANIPSRIAFAVSSQVDSRTILDTSGAEKLLGRGDMLFLPVGASKPKRIQGCFVSDKEIEKVVDHVKQSRGSQYSEDVSNEIEHQAELAAKAAKKSRDVPDDDRSDDVDEALLQAIEFVIDAGQASTSMLQRRLRVGYARAGRLIDEMEQMGIIGPHEGSKPRTVLMTKTQFMEMKLRMSDDGGAAPDVTPNADQASDTE